MKCYYPESFGINRLQELKHQRQVTISLGLPALNEAPTIGKVIECAQSCQPLVDEIMVFDSGSTDNTVAVCRQYGLPVVVDQEVATKLGVPLARGKGWNLWSSVSYLKGDFILWIDTDIENISPIFILGIVAPFLIDPQVKFVKGFYKRPKGDARVTEILVRPFLNLLFPETAEFIQPLAGEYGGTRDFLESAVFYSGYSVEVAILLQAILEYGPNCVAQSFLNERIHPLQDVPSLGRMGASILHTLLHLAQQYNRLDLNVGIPGQIKVFDAITGQKDISSEIISIADNPLPRVIDIR